MSAAMSAGSSSLDLADILDLVAGRRAGRLASNNAGIDRELIVRVVLHDDEPVVAI